MKLYILFILLVCSLYTHAQELTGEVLLDRSIAFHDPENEWKTFKGKLLIEMETPNASLRKTSIDIDFQKQYFKTTVTRGHYAITSELNKGDCTLKLNGSTTISPKIKDSLGISCDRAKTIKNYYTYLYGLPMKLKDPGTQLDAKVYQKKFKGKEYLVLKATYDQKVGKDTWYFYFDPNTYAMEVYQFFHDEAQNDGEYIILADLVTLNTLKLPKVRAWYYNKDDKYLGTDTLLKASKEE